MPNINVQAVILILQGDKAKVEGEFAIYIEQQRTYLLQGASPEEGYFALGDLTPIQANIKLPTVLTAGNGQA